MELEVLAAELQQLQDENRQLEEELKAKEAGTGISPSVFRPLKLL